MDKYVELELVIIFLDLLLLRPQVYRHLLFNRIKYHEHGIDVRTPQSCTTPPSFEASTREASTWSCLVLLCSGSTHCVLQANCMKIGLVYVMFEAGLKYFSSYHVGQDLNYPYLLGTSAYTYALRLVYALHEGCSMLPSSSSSSS